MPLLLIPSWALAIVPVEDDEVLVKAKIRSTVGFEAVNETVRGFLREWCGKQFVHLVSQPVVSGRVQAMLPLVASIPSSPSAGSWKNVYLAIKSVRPRREKEHLTEEAIELSNLQDGLFDPRPDRRDVAGNLGTSSSGDIPTGLLAIADF